MHAPVAGAAGASNPAELLEWPLRLVKHDIAVRGIPVIGFPLRSHLSMAASRRFGLRGGWRCQPRLGASASEKGPLRIAFPNQVVESYFPLLFTDLPVDRD